MNLKIEFSIDFLYPFSWYPQIRVFDGFLPRKVAISHKNILKRQNSGNL